MRGLDDHFGKNVELGENERKAICGYLLNHSARRDRGGLPNRIAAFLSNHRTPLQITKTRFFRHAQDGERQ